jgi:hypothetical protein
LWARHVAAILSWLEALQQGTNLLVEKVALRTITRYSGRSNFCCES